jgi:hypothetical protein
VIENNTRSIVSIHNVFLYTINMENVPTTKSDAWLLSKSRTITDRAVIVFSHIWFQMIGHFSNTLWLKAGHAFLFSM